MVIITPVHMPVIHHPIIHPVHALPDPTTLQPTHMVGANGHGIWNHHVTHNPDIPTNQTVPPPFIDPTFLTHHTAQSTHIGMPDVKEYLVKPSHIATEVKMSVGGHAGAHGMIGFGQTNSQWHGDLSGSITHGGGSTCHDVTTSVSYTNHSGSVTVGGSVSHSGCSGGPQSSSGGLSATINF